MFERAVRIAISKAGSPAEADALTKLVPSACRVDEQERTFEERINRNKALRGEPPTKMSKRKKADIDSYAADANEMTANQLLQFEALDSAASVIKCLEMAMVHDIAFWSQAQGKAHEADRPLVRDFAAVKIDLQNAFSAYLAEHYAEG